MKKLLGILVLGLLLNINFNVSNANIVEELNKLNNLYKEGAINKEEFSKAKSILLKSEQTEDSSIKKKIKKYPKRKKKYLKKKIIKKYYYQKKQDLLMKI